MLKKKLKKILLIPVTIKIKEKNIRNYFKCFFYDIRIILKNFLLTRKATKSTQGYIDSAIHSNAYVFELPYSYCIIFSKILNLIFDGIFIHWKFTSDRNDKNINLKLIKLSKKFSIKKIIVDGRDTSLSKIENEVLDKFDFVIKQHRNKSINNKKYMTTMLPLKSVNYEISKKQEIINWNKIGKSKPNERFKYDIFFSGSPNNKKRSEVIELLKSKKLNFYGGFQKLPFNEYIDTIYNSSINLAMAGTGGAEFTFRHLEILSCCSFMMCHNEINQIELPLPIKDGEHFVTFEKKEDLLEKINYYLKNEHLRSKISLNGRETLEKYYSPKNHGNFIINRIFT